MPFWVAQEDIRRYHHHLALLTLATAVHSLRSPLCDLSHLFVPGAPWWSWVGGVLGAYYVIVNICFAQKLGSGTAVAVFVCSQLCMSVVLDLTGLVGFQKRAFSWCAAVDCVGFVHFAKCRGVERGAGPLSQVSWG
jgi:uncharacterized membrane protein YdcZ (DUF606 family)